MNNKLQDRDKKVTKLYLLISYIVYFGYEIAYHYIYPLVPNTFFNSLSVTIWPYLMMLCILSVCMYFIKTKYHHKVKYVFLFSYLLLFTLIEIFLYTSLGGNVLEIAIIIFSPMFMSRSFFWSATIGTILKFIIVGLALQDPTVLVPIVLVIALSIMSYILLKSFIDAFIAMKNSYQRELTVLKYSPDPIIMHTDGIIEYANEAAVRLFSAATAEELINKSTWEFMNEEISHPVNQRVGRIMNAEKTDFIEQKLQRLNGEMIDIEINSTSIDLPDGTQSIQSVIRNITERKKKEAILRKMDKMSGINQLAAGIAHEIKNPLSTVRGFMQLMLQKSNEDQPHLKLMLSEVDRINQIVKEFMFLSRPAEPETFKRLDILELIHEILPLMQAEALMKNVQIVTTRKSDDCMIDGVSDMLKQIFINMINNAIEAMPEGGNVYIQIEKKQPDKISIQIKDEGCGIPSEILPRIGEPFFTTKPSGNGLGLMICYRVIEIHKGKLEVKSEPDQGTTIDMELQISN